MTIRDMRFRRPPIVVLNVALAGIALAGAGWAYTLVGVASSSAATVGSTTRVVTVSQGTVLASVSASGSVQSANTATADFATSGTVSSILVKVGDVVKKGQVLAKVDPTDAEAGLNTADANLAAARASLTRANSGGDAASIASAQAQVTSAEATRGQAARAVDGTVLRAPLAGTVTAINGSVGGSASGASAGSGSSGSANSAGSGGAGSGSSAGGGSSAAGSGSAGTASGFIQLADTKSMEVAANFAEADATKLKTGQTATVTWAALTGATATAKIATIAPTAITSNNVNSYAVVASLASLPPGIRMGQTVTVAVTVAQAANVVRVPSAAVRSVGNRHTVTVLISGQPQVRAVEIGVEGDSFTQILSGLIVGDQVEIVIQAPTANNGGLRGGGGLGGAGAGGFGGGGVGGPGGVGGGPVGGGNR